MTFIPSRQLSNESRRGDQTTETERAAHVNGARAKAERTPARYLVSREIFLWLFKKLVSAESAFSKSILSF